MSLFMSLAFVAVMLPTMWFSVRDLARAHRPETVAWTAVLAVIITAIVRSAF